MSTLLTITPPRWFLCAAGSNSCQRWESKISPGVKLAELREYDAELEFISVKGELKKAVIWMGPLKTARTPRHAASRSAHPDSRLWWIRFQVRIMKVL